MKIITFKNDKEKLFTDQSSKTKERSKLKGVSDKNNGLSSSIPRPIAPIR